MSISNDIKSIEDSLGLLKDTKKKQSVSTCTYFVLRFKITSF